MTRISSFLAPALVASMGAAIWIVVSVIGRWEFGLLALGIGAAVGGATMWGGRNSAFPYRGWVAVCLTLLAIGGGKLGAAWMEVRREYEEFRLQVEQAGGMTATAETAKFHLALDWIEQKESLGERLAWPDEGDADTAASPTELPPEAWAEATRMWEALSEAEKARQIAIAQAAFRAFGQTEATGWGIADLGEIVWKNLDMGDALFALLASLAAYRIAILRGAGAALANE